jgi:hypothetical protein
MTSEQTSKAAKVCPKCGVIRPYNPQYKNSGLCSTCRAYDDADRFLKGYRNKDAYKK